jgi:hypothetical protein
MSQAIINETKRLARAIEQQALDIARLTDRLDSLETDLVDNYQRKRGPKVRTDGETTQAAL